MDEITYDELKSLATVDNAACVSLYMPLHRTGQERQQNPIRFRNLVESAEERLIADGMRGADAKRLLLKMRDLQQDEAFWRFPSSAGLALLLSSDFYRCAPLDFACPEIAAVGKQFYLSPLAHALVRDDRFLIFALSPKNVKLFRCRSRQILSLALPDAMPKNIDTALSGTEIEKSLQHHTSAPVGRGGSIVGIVHGHGSPKDDQQVLLSEYVRIVSRHLNQVLATEELPLVLAAVDYLHPMLQESVRYPHLVDKGVVGSPDELSDQEMLERALALVETKFLRALQSAVRRYRDVIATDRAGHRLETILPAAEQGRVESLFTALGEQVWGTFDPETGTVVTHANRQPDDIDLLDLVLARTLTNGGTPFVVNGEEVPNDGPVAALFRW